MEERYVAHLWSDKLRGEIIIAVFLIAISVIILNGGWMSFLMLLVVRQGRQMPKPTNLGQKYV